jgi:YHS domain-containing protein
MSWKLSTLAIALFGLLASGLAQGGQNALRQQPSQSNNSSVVAAADAGSLADAKPTDKELIAQQKTCPVSDQPLGSMGKPVKLVYQGRTVFLCCQGCKKTFQADPEKYIKKLDDKK